MRQPNRHSRLRSTSVRHPLSIWLALAAIVYRALIPAGFMLGDHHQADGGRWLVWCSAQAPLLAAQAAGAPDHRGHADHQAPSCAFASAAAAALPSGVASSPTLASRFQPVPDARGRHIAAFTPHLRPPLRGPPILAG